MSRRDRYFDEDDFDHDEEYNPRGKKKPKHRDGKKDKRNFDEEKDWDDSMDQREHGSGRWN